MAGLLQVDIEALGKAVHLLRNSEQVLNDAMKALAHSGHTDIGTKTLDDAADSFQRDGISESSASARLPLQPADGLSRCHDAYQQVDTQFAQLIAQTTTPALPGGCIPRSGAGRHRRPIHPVHRAHPDTTAS
ncbi:hypothetical protein [Nocardia nova]|uniref:hypothetical protein n=1 Tax=Nocardia nova TaxID=37330 RepID=UPI0011B0E331|nr:hypothetical protein [Nocardia nova]